MKATSVRRDNSCKYIIQSRTSCRDTRWLGCVRKRRETTRLANCFLDICPFLQSEGPIFSRSFFCFSRSAHNPHCPTSDAERSEQGDADQFHLVRICEVGNAIAYWPNRIRKGVGTGRSGLVQSVKKLQGWQIHRKTGQDLKAAKQSLAATTELCTQAVETHEASTGARCRAKNHCR